MTEEEIVQGCISNDRRCQSTLYKKYFPLLSSIALRYYDNQDDALQAMNLGFLKVLNKIKTYDSKYALATWIRHILVNHIIDDFRKTARYTEKTLITDFHDSNEQTSINLIEEKWEEEELRHMLEVLPLTTKNVFNLYAIDGFKHKEIADMLGISEGTSKWHVSDARKKLKKQMEIKTIENTPKVKVSNSN